MIGTRTLTAQATENRARHTLVQLLRQINASTWTPEELLRNSEFVSAVADLMKAAHVTKAP